MLSRWPITADEDGGGIIEITHTDDELTPDVSSHSEFPSLSGGPQTHTPNPSQAIWANATQRTAQQSVIQRQPQAPAPLQQASRIPQSQPPLPPQQQPESQTEQPEDDPLSSPPQQLTGQGQVDPFQGGGQTISGQLSSGSQPQPGSIDEFPPLGKGTPVDLSQERRETLLPGGFGTYGTGMKLT